MLIALVRDIAAGKARLFVDGQLDVELDLNADSDGTISNLDDADPVTIGGGWGGGRPVRIQPSRSRGSSTRSTGGGAPARSGDRRDVCPPRTRPGSAATAPAAGRWAAVTVNYTVSGKRPQRADPVVREPGAAGFTEAARTRRQRQLTFTPTAAGASASPRAPRTPAVGARRRRRPGRDHHVTALPPRPDHAAGDRRQ